MTSHPLRITLIEPTPTFRVSLEAGISEPNGPLILDDDDSSSSAGAFGCDLERHLLIPPESKDALLLALLAQTYQGDSSTLSKLRDLIETKGIPYQFFSY